MGDSQQGRGATFHFTLPAEVMNQSVAESGVAPVIEGHDPDAAGAPGSKVFIIETTLPVRASIADLLQSAGLASETFGTPQEFLPPPPRRPGLHRAGPATSGMDGLAVQRALAEASPCQSSSSPRSPMSDDEGDEVGRDGVLTKPFDDQELLDAISRALERDHVARDQQHELSTLQIATPG